MERRRADERVEKKASQNSITRIKAGLPQTLVNYKLFCMRSSSLKINYLWFYFSFFSEKATINQLSLAENQEQVKLFRQNMQCVTLQPSVVPRRKPRWKKKYFPPPQSWKPQAMPKPRGTITHRDLANLSKFNLIKIITSLAPV